MTDSRGRHRPGSSTSRRQFLAGVAVGSYALAGCVGGDDDGADDGPEELTEEIQEDRKLNGVVLSSSFPIQLFEGRTDDRVAEVHYHEEFSHWHFMPFEVPLDGYRPVEARIFDSDQEVIPLGPDERFQLEITRAEETPEELVEIEISQGNLVNFHGTGPGEGDLFFDILEDDETVWTSPPFTVAVAEDFDSE